MASSVPSGNLTSTEGTPRKWSSKVSYCCIEARHGKQQKTYWTKYRPLLTDVSRKYIGSTGHIKFPIQNCGQKENKKKRRIWACIGQTDYIARIAPGMESTWVNMGRPRTTRRRTVLWKVLSWHESWLQIKEIAQNICHLDCFCWSPMFWLRNWGITVRDDDDDEYRYLKELTTNNFCLLSSSHVRKSGAISFFSPISTLYVEIGEKKLIFNQRYCTRIKDPPN